MKKILTILFAVFLLVGCTAGEDYDYTGSYVLLKKGNACNLVIHWEYPNSEITQKSYEVDTSNISQYIDESLSTEGTGVNLNMLLGSLGYNRAFLSAQPIKINGANADKIAKKKISIYLHLTDTNGNTHKVKLKYDKSIKD